MIYLKTSYSTQNKSFICLALLLLIASLVFTSCDEDDDPKTEKPSLEGIVWVQTSFEYTSCNSDDLNGGNQLECTDQNCQSVIFDNGTARYTEVRDGISETTDFRYVLLGDDSFSSGGITATYQITDDVLNVSSDNPLDGCTLIETYRADG